MACCYSGVRGSAQLSCDTDGCSPTFGRRVWVQELLLLGEDIVNRRQLCNDSVALSLW